MGVERFSAGVDPAATADRVHALAPGAESVAGAVREIVDDVREHGDVALRALRRALRPRRAESCASRARRSRPRSTALDPAVRAGLEIAIANVRAVAEADLGADVEVALPQGQTVTLRDIPVGRAAIYVPGGRAPYPSTVVMGVVTARAAGVEEVVVCAPGAHPVILAACALCGADAVFSMGGAHAVAALAFGTETVPRADVIAGPGNLYVQEAKRIVSGHVGIDGFAGPSDVVVLASAGADPALVSIDLAAQAEHGTGTVVCAVSPEPALLDAIEIDPGDAVAALVDAPDLETALAFAEAFAPEHLELVGRRGGGARAPHPHRRGAVRRARERDRLRRLRRGLEPHPPDRRRRALRLAARPAPLPAAHERGADRPGRRSARPCGAPIARAEGFERHAVSMEVRENGARVSRRADITRETGETFVEMGLGLDGSGAGSRTTGVGFLDHMLDLVARHGRLDLDVAARGDLDTGAHHTAEDVGIVLGQALDRALGDRAGITRYGHAVVPMDEARAACAIDFSGRPFLAFDAHLLPPGVTGGFDHELTEEFFRAVSSSARITLHITIEAGTNAHHMIEAAFKAFARALRAAIAIDPSESGVPSTKGTLTT